MSEYDKPQDYNVYGQSSLNTCLVASTQGSRRVCRASRLMSVHVKLRQGAQLTNVTHSEYNATTRPEHGHSYATFGVQPTFSTQYVSTHAQVPSGLPPSNALPMVAAAPQYSATHDPTYNPPIGQQYAQHSAYVATTPREVPEIISYVPQEGRQGTRVAVYFRSIYDLDNPPIQAFLMFGQQRVQSHLVKTSQQGQMYQYEISAVAPAMSASNTPSPSTPIHLVFDIDNFIQWDSPSIEIGSFTYLNSDVQNYPTGSPSSTRKRKLSPQASPRRSPLKKPSGPQLAPPRRTAYTAAAVVSRVGSYPGRRDSGSDPYQQQSRRGSAVYHGPPYGLPSPSASHQYYGGQSVGQPTPSMFATQSPRWSAYQQLPGPSIGTMTRSPSAAAISAGSGATQLLPSPSGGSNPPLVRTSTLQQSPNTPAHTPSQFNPYAIYPANTKATLKIEGDLSEMADKWTEHEWEAKRRLVQFSRSQSGSVITATFEAVTPETRAPNSICVSCIWWEEKQMCYVTSVDTIQLLEALVAVRFTVEEKNRIRRNLEGFRPATVSKTKQDSEEFFKLIMGFPSPKPRNIEKDVKVFPWRILVVALKKIISKYASHLCSALRDAGSPASCITDRSFIGSR